MKLLLSAFSFFLAPALAVTANTKDQYHLRDDDHIGPAMWVFGDEGLKIYSPDGKSLRKSTSAERVCHETSGYRGSTEVTLSCSFYDVVSDGKKFVWAAVSRGSSKIDVFSIDTGDIVGSFETCNTPRDLEYHPLRDEMWVRCLGVTENEVSYMDVFSVQSPTVDSTTRILMSDNTTDNSYGYMAIDNTMGDVGYTTMWGSPFLYKIGLSEKVVLEKFDIELAHGGYELAYSPVNQHIFVRALTCCTCGFEGADLGVDCGRYGTELVNITTGPSAGQNNVDGQCGRCDGSVADTLGVYEFDTNAETFVGKHLMEDGLGGDPFASPDGKYIVMFGRNGGRSVRVLEAGNPGKVSTVAFDIKLDFNTTSVEDDAVFNDFAFIQDGEREMIVLASGNENKLVLIDLKSSNPSTSYISFRDGDISADGTRRQVEWAVGTNYVWVDGADASEVYIIDVGTKQVVETLTNVNSTKMVFVQNYERTRLQNMITGESGFGSDSSSMERAFGANYEDDNDIDAVGIISLILATVALAVGVVNLVVMKNRKPQSHGQPTSSINTSSKMDEEVSLGSKNVA